MNTASLSVQQQSRLCSHKHSYSQLGQDTWVADMLRPARPGFFVEVGAFDGRIHSNTLLFEEMGWSGICVEPSSFFAKLCDNRRCVCDSRAILGRRGEVWFCETPSAVWSGVPEFFRDGYDRGGGKCYRVAAITLDDLLTRHCAPQVIDYLSLDTEGSEFDILQAVDFDKHIFRCITVEHNGVLANRFRIAVLLIRHGYKLQQESGFDDWYIFQGEIA